ncbi:MAG: restriction endonuclease [Verrucomicrobia bacterium]|nr:MAG: restriction endonuclease [Verrucomicrobiota bacterium]
MDARLRQSVRHRANGRCEYCGLLQTQEPLAFHIEHIIARQHKGPDVAENLALACHHCNLHKGTNLSGIDPQTGEVVRLFHPRKDEWVEHFASHGGLVIGLTAIGRATAALLRMNQDGRAELRWIH